MARPSSPAIPAMKARAWSLAIVKDGARVERAEVGDNGRHPAQPDALLRRERRPDRRHRKTDHAQRASTARSRTRRSRSASSTCFAPRSIAGRARRSATPSTRRSTPSAATASAPTTAPPTCSTRRCATGSARMSRQKGSLVAPDHFRFDFSHPKALTREEIEAVEAEVNAQIRVERAGRPPG